MTDSPTIRDVVAVLRRADRSWCLSTADEPRDKDYLTHLAVALRPLLAAETGRDVEGLRTEVRRQRRLIGNLRADYAALKDECAEKLRRKGVA